MTKPLSVGCVFRDHSPRAEKRFDLFGANGLKGIPTGQIRLGGMVTSGSLVKAADGVTLSFVVHDENNQIPVRFRGIPPDLFKEGSGVVAEGAFDGKTFVANNLLAKHDENYKPPQMAGKEHKTDTLKP
jgi:cytochrome c-type biogenesis protein CcmE